MKRLFDLVKCPNEQLRVAFYYAMRDTVVAEDLEQASRIAYGQDRRWRRVVTVKVGGCGGWFRAGRGSAASQPCSLLLPTTNAAPCCAGPAVCAARRVR